MERILPDRPPPAAANTGAGATLEAAEALAESGLTRGQKRADLGELITALWLPAMMLVTSESSSRRSTSSTAGFQTREIRRSIDSTPP